MTDTPSYQETSPVVGIGEVVLVTIEAPEFDHVDDTPNHYGLPAYRVHHASNTLISDFVQWQYDNGIHPYKGRTSATDFYAATFPVEHAEQIRNFFADRIGS